MAEEIKEVEKILRPPEKVMPPYPPKVITLKNGEKMVVRQVAREEALKLLDAIRPVIWVDKDYYDIVGARTYAELLGWYRYRVRDEYALVGLVNGELYGIVNGRILDENVGISYHTLALKRGLRVEANLFAAKMEYHIEYLGQKEVWITAESPIGFRRWMLTWRLEEKPGVQHELGGAKTWVLTRENYFKVRDELVKGERPVPEDLLKTAERIYVPPQQKIIRRVMGLE